LQKAESTTYINLNYSAVHIQFMLFWNFCLGMLTWNSRFLQASSRWFRSVVLLRQRSKYFGRIIVCRHTDFL